jgi:hypothetical protein
MIDPNNLPDGWISMTAAGYPEGPYEEVRNVFRGEGLKLMIRPCIQTWEPSEPNWRSFACRERDDFLLAISPIWNSREAAIAWCWGYAFKSGE